MRASFRWVGAVCACLVLLTPLGGATPPFQGPASLPTSHPTERPHPSLPASPDGIPALQARPSCSTCVVQNLSLPIEAQGIAYDPVNGDLYVVGPDPSAGWLAPVDVVVLNASTNTIVQTVKGVGSNPSWIAADTATGDVYVANYQERNSTGYLYGNSNVTVLDGATNRPVRSIQVGNGPSGITYDPADGNVYVMNDYSSNVSVIHGANRSLVGSFPFTTINAWGLAWDPHTDEVYTVDHGQGSPTNACQISNNAEWFNASTWVQGVGVPAFCEPLGITVDPSNDRVYTANSWSNNSTVFDGATHARLGSIPVGVDPVATYYDPWDGLLYFLCGGGDNLTIVDPTLGRSVASIAGLHPVDTLSGPYLTSGMAASGPQGFLYVTNSAPGYQSVAVVSTPRSLQVPTSVQIAPAYTALPYARSVSLTASASCSGGACASGLIFSWTVNSPLATLGASTGTPVTLTTGSTPGFVTVFVNATLNGRSVQAQDGPIAISNNVGTLVSVALAPTSASLGLNQTQAFVANTACTSACAPGLVYLWSLSDPTLARLNRTSGSTVDLTSAAAGPGGSDVLTVVATLNGASQSVSATVTVAAAPPSGQPSGFLGLPGIEGYLLVSAPTAALAGLVVLLLVRRKRASKEEGDHEPSEGTRPPPKYEHKRPGENQP